MVAPIYIPSRSRWTRATAARLVEAAGLTYHLVVEPAQADDYRREFGRDKVLCLPWDNAPGTMDGALRARNWIIDHAEAQGHAWHWQLDDNIRAFLEKTSGRKTPTTARVVLEGVERQIAEYDNVLMAGPAYDAWVWDSEEYPELRANVVAASAMLIRGNLPYRFQSLQEDLDLTLQILSGGDCTARSNLYLIRKPRAMTVPGGLADAYQNGGKKKFAEDLAARWPGIASVVQRPNGDWGLRTSYKSFRQTLHRTGDPPPVVRSPWISLIDYKRMPRQTRAARG